MPEPTSAVHSPTHVRTETPADVVEAGVRTVPESPAAAPPVGSAVPPVCPGYEMLDVLGRGARSVVYRVRKRDGGRILALKVFRAGTPADLQRFTRSAEMPARLR